MRQFGYTSVAYSVECGHITVAKADVTGKTVVTVVLVLDDVDAAAKRRFQFASENRDPLEPLIIIRSKVRLMGRPVLAVGNQEVEQDSKGGIGNLKPRVPDHHNRSAVDSFARDGDQHIVAGVRARRAESSPAGIMRRPATLFER